MAAILLFFKVRGKSQPPAIPKARTIHYRTFKIKKNTKPPPGNKEN